jgi:hypothetical protein
MPIKNDQTFSKYPNPIFLETGSSTGDGIQAALDAGFKKIISIELSDKYFEISKNRFLDNPCVKIYHGDSYKILPDILKDIDENVTFWLDGHHSCGDTALGDYWAPLIQELVSIKNHHIKRHTILIDDMRCWELPNPVHGFYKDDIFNKLIEINPNYKFKYENGYQDNDILVAYP